MRTRSESAGPVALEVNHSPHQSGRPTGGGRWFKPNLWGGQKAQSQAAVGRTTPPNGGHHTPKDKEPKTVVLKFEEILQAEDAQHLCEASRQLIEREERLFGDTMETDSLTHHAEDLDKLAVDYKHLKSLIFTTLRLSLSPEKVSVEALTSAVKALNQEVNHDQQWKKGNQPESTRVWRHEDLKELHDRTLRSLVEERMENPVFPLPDQVDMSSFQVDVNSMGRQLKEDLLLVVKVVKRCYPPEQDICNFYARLYHQIFSSRLGKIADFGLGDKDATFLLRWVNEYYPQILQKPELSCEINAGALGKLLPEKLLKPLEEQFLSKQKEELQTYIVRVLEEAEQKWKDGEEPTREDGCFVSHVGFDIIQLIHGRVSSAASIVGDIQKAQIITSHLNALMQSFQSFHNNAIKQNKPNSKPFIKANLGCIQQFTELLNEKRHLFQDDVQTKCLQILADMKQSAHTYLLKPVHDVLKPKYSQLGTSDWLNKPVVFETLLDGLDMEIQELQGSIQPCHQELIGQLHQEVTAEYVRRLLKRKIKLKDREQQHEAYQKIKDNAESLQDLFGRMGSMEDWLNEILTKIAEVLKLQDLPAIQMEIGSLVTAFPDLSEKHVSALLKLKTNVSRADRRTAKETLSDYLKEIDNVASRPFFSKIQVK